MAILTYMKKSHGSHLRETAAKQGQQLRRRSPSQHEGGYTLLELLVVVMLVGILAAIAGPGWLTFVNRQRINALRGEVYQTLQTAQSDAKKNKLSRTVTFSTFSNSKNDVPQVSINGGPLQQLGQGQIKKGQITEFKTYTTTTSGTKTTYTITTLPITFDYQGNVTTTSSQNGASASPPYIVTLSGAGGKRCVSVQTLLGGMRTANEKDCP
jgi:prepilin-type N-terminal cleavage/methylation domain-containing protein